MRRKAIMYGIGTLAVFGFVIAGALIWQNGHVADLPQPAAPAPVVIVAAPTTAEPPAVELAEEASAPSNIDPSAPVRIKIPSIAVDAAIEQVALTATGSMDVPRDPLNTAWYALGPRPGETGSAAIAGHVDWFNGATAVFADLHKVQSGDTITVQNADGAVVSFVVREIRTFDADADATEVFSSYDGKAHLNLITCKGVWDKDANQYTQRLVVFADRTFE